jgi:DNA-binding NarL/FixJ family response regulator
MKILLVDDHQILLDGLAFLLNRDETISEVKAVNSVKLAWETLEDYRPDIVVSDISIPGEGGIAFVKQLKERDHNLQAIFLSMHEEPYLVREALSTGAEGYVLKKTAHEELINAIAEVSRGGLFFSPEVQKILVRRLQFPDDEKLLTTREKEILQLIFDDHSNKEIGVKLNISERTVEAHRRNIYEKTKTNTLVGLLRFALDNGLVIG